MDDRDAGQDVHNNMDARDIEAAVQVGTVHGGVNIQPAQPPQKNQTIVNTGDGAIITQDGQVHVYRRSAVQDTDSGATE